MKRQNSMILQGPPWFMIRLAWRALIVGIRCYLNGNQTAILMDNLEMEFTPDE